MELTRLASLVAEKTGFDQKALSERRLMALYRRLEREGLSLDEAANHPRLEEWASEAISVGETYFFRQAEHFEFLMHHAKGGVLAQRPLLAWSAGCSTGEEAWSIAACLSDGPQAAQGLQVLGTDMSEKSLVTAREGRYGKWSQRREGAGMPLALQPSGESEMEVLPELRRLTRFERHNLLEPAPFLAAGLKAGVIFCRNVLIYLSPAAVRRVVDNLAAALDEGGYLLLGSVDVDFTPAGLVPEEPRVLQIYRKPRAVAASPKAKARKPEAATAQRLKPAFDPKEAHIAALHLVEAGKDALALQGLFELRVQAPDYLPGLFDLALALSRKGAKREAAATMESLLEAAQGQDLSDVLNAPEPVSLAFYVTSAQIFLERYGKNP
jgi:chemotaxis protein methyltransferase CheR